MKNKFSFTFGHNTPYNAELPSWDITVNALSENPFIVAQNDESSTPCFNCGNAILGMLRPLKINYLPIVRR